MSDQPTYSFTTDQWIRKWGLYASGTNGVLALSQGGDAPGQEQLHFVFHVRQNGAAVPNTAIIRLYNPSVTTVNKIVNEYQRVRIEAGYQTGRFGLIFDGFVKQYRYGKENPTDTFLELYCADADLAFNFGTIAKTMAAGTTPAQVADVIAKDAIYPYGVQSAGKVDFGPAVPARRGVVMNGMGRDEMSQLVRTHEKVWFIDNGQLVFADPDTANDGDVVVLRSDTGMIGFPEQTQQGVTVTCLMNPSIHVWRMVQIDNKSINVTQSPPGQSTGNTNTTIFPAPSNVNSYVPLNADGYYYALVVEHSGDTRGNEWYTQVTAVAAAKNKDAQPDSPFPDADAIAAAADAAVSSGRIS